MKFAPRFTLRALIIVVTLVCLYFGAWEATKRYGVATTVPDDLPAAITAPYEDSPMPLIIRRTEYGYFHESQTYSLWLFGPKIELPFGRPPSYE